MGHVRSHEGLRRKSDRSVVAVSDQKRLPFFFTIFARFFFPAFVSVMRGFVQLTTYDSAGFVGLDRGFVSSLVQFTGWAIGVITPFCRRFAWATDPCRCTD